MRDRMRLALVIVSLLALRPVQSQNAVYGCGSNEQGALGFGPIDSYGAPDQHLLTAPDWSDLGGVPVGLQKVSAGYLFSLALGGSGTIYSWGLNSQGQLGLGDQTTRDSVSSVVWTAANPYPASGIVTIYAGDAVSLAVAGDGTLYVWGWLTYTQPTPLIVTNPMPVAWTNSAQPSGGVNQVSAGVGHIAVVGADKHAYAWGTNTDGQLCDWTNFNRDAPVAMVWAPATASEPSNGVLQAAAGGAHTVILGGDNEVYTCGSNTQGQLGVGSFTSYNQPVAVRWGVSGWPAFPGAVTQVAAGLTHTIVVGVDGQAYSWGSDTYSEQGGGEQGVLFGYIYPQEVIWAGGAFFPAGGIAAVRAGNHGSAVLSAGGALFTWGYNVHGTSCDGTTVAYPYPHPAPWFGAISVLGSISPSAIHMTLISAPNVVPMVPTPSSSFVPPAPGSQHVICWGQSQDSDLGQATSLPIMPTEVNFGVSGFPSTGLRALYGGTNSRSLAAITGDGIALVWGNNFSGQLGIGPSPTKTAVPTPVQWNSAPAPVGGVVSVSTGGTYTLAVGADNQAYGWGSNQFGVLCMTASSTLYYYPIMIASSGPIVGVAAGAQASYYVDLNGLGYACGTNGGAQLGVGSSSGSLAVASMTPFASNPSVFPIGQIYAGFRHGLMLVGGIAYNWGQGAPGGSGSTSGRVNTPTAASFGVSGCAPLPASGIVAIATGLNHNLALDGDGVVYGWGINSDGQAGTGKATANVYCPMAVSWVTATPVMVAITAASVFSTAIADTGEVYAWGHPTTNDIGSNHGAGASSFGLPFPILAISSKAAALASVNLGTCAIVTNDEITEFSPSPTPDPDIDELMCFGMAPYVADGVATGYFATPVDAVWSTVGGAPRVGLRKLIPAGASLLGTSQGVSAVIDVNGRMYTWGLHNNGGLGTGQIQADQPLPVEWRSAPEPAGGVVDAAFTVFGGIALSANGHIYGWGTNSNTVLCIVLTNTLVGGTTSLAPYPVQLSNNTFAQIGAGAQTNYFVDTNGIGYACGTNTNGEAEVGNTAAATGMRAILPPPNGAPITTISGGNKLGYMLAGGVVYVWGTGPAANGGTSVTVATPANFGVAGCAAIPALGIQAIAPGLNHIVALDFNGLVYSWGANTNQQLGHDGTTSTTCPKAVVWPGAVPVVVSVHANGFSSAAFTDTGVVYVWGSLVNNHSPGPPRAISGVLPGITSIAHGVQSLCYIAPGVRHPPTSTPSHSPHPSQSPYPPATDLCSPFGYSMVSPNFVNGDFEAGGLRGWTVTTQRDASLGSYFATSGRTAPISFERIARAPEGGWYAVSDQRTSGSYVLHQDFFVPAGITQLYITFYMTCNSRWPASVQSTMSWMPPPATNQQCRVDIVDPSFDDWFGANVNTGVIQNVVAPFATADGLGADPFVQYNIQLNLTGNQWYRLAFRSVNDVYFLNNGIDGVTLCYVPGGGSGGGGSGSPAPSLSPSPSVSSSSSSTQSPSFSSTATRTVSPTNTASATVGSSRSFSASSTRSVSEHPSVSGSRSFSASSSASRSSTRSASNTASVTPTVSTTSTASKTRSTTPTSSVSASNTASITPTISDTASPSLSRSNSKSVSISNTPSESSSVSTTSTRTATRSRSFSRSISESLSQGTTPSSTATETRSVSKTPTVTRTTSITETPTTTISASPSFAPSKSATSSVSASLSASVTPSKSESGSNTPTKSETGSITRSTFPTKSPSESFVQQPSAPAQLSATRNPSQTSAPSRSTSVSNSFSSSASYSPSETSSVSTSESGSHTRTATRSRSFTASRSSTETATPSLTHGASQSSTETASASMSSTSSTSSSSSKTPSTSFSRTASETRSVSLSPVVFVSPSNTPSKSFSPTISQTSSVSSSPASFGYIIITVSTKTLFPGDTATVIAQLPSGAIALSPITVILSYAGTATSADYSAVPHHYVSIAQGATTGFITITATHSAPRELSLYALSVTNGLINSTDQYFSIALVIDPSTTSTPSTTGSTTETATESNTPSNSATPSVVLSRTPSITPSPSRTSSRSASVSRTPSVSLSFTRSISVTRTATNTPTPGTLITIAMSSPTISPGGTVTLTATLVTATITAPVTVVLSWAGTATLGSDYSRTAANIVIPAGQITGIVTITDLEATTPTSNAPAISISVTSVQHANLQAGTPTNYSIQFV